MTKILEFVTLNLLNMGLSLFIPYEHQDSYTETCLSESLGHMIIDKRDNRNQLL